MFLCDPLARLRLFNRVVTCTIVLIVSVYMYRALLFLGIV